VKEEVTREPLTENESRHAEWSVGKGLELEFVSAMFLGSRLLASSTSRIV
jgi:hypothetical protein